MTYEHLLLDIQDHIGTIKLNRPEVLNAMNRKLFSEIDEAVTQLENDDDVHAIIFTGAGERAFSAGADIHEMAEQARMDNPPPPDPRRAEYSWHIATARKPTIGALNGLAFGGGAVLASSFDIRVGCERTQIQIPRRPVRQGQLHMEPPPAGRLAARQGASLHRASGRG